MSTGFIYQRSIIRVISTHMYLSEVTEPQCLKKKKRTSRQNSSFVSRGKYQCGGIKSAIIHSMLENSIYCLLGKSVPQ